MLKTGLLLINTFQPAEWKSIVQNAESLGYDYLWHADERFFREVYCSLTFAALHTRRIRLGPCVTDPFSRHPALTAMAIGTLDEFSDSRAVLVLGAGKSGFNEMGIIPKKSALAIREAIGLIRQLWQGGPVSYQGKVISFREGQLNFTTRPDIPIFVATEGPITLRYAGEVADGVIIGSMAVQANVGKALGHIDKGLANARRRRTDIEIGVRLDTCLAEDPSTARRPLKSIILRMLFRYRPEFEPFTSIGLSIPAKLASFLEDFEYRGYSRDGEVIEQYAELVPDDLVDPFCLAGTPDEIVVRIRELQALGISHVTIYPIAPAGGNVEETIRRFANEVVPQVRQAKED